MSFDEWSSPETVYSENSPEPDVLIFGNDDEDGIRLAHDPEQLVGYVEEKQPRQAITITIPLPWSKRSSKRSASLPPKPDSHRQEYETATFPKLESLQQNLPPLDVPQHLSPDQGMLRGVSPIERSEQSRRMSPLERSKKTISPVMTTRAAAQAPLLTPVVESSERSPPANQTMLIVPPNDLHITSTGVHREHTPMPIQVNNLTRLQQPKLTPAKLAFGNPLNSHPPSRNKGTSSSHLSDPTTSTTPAIQSNTPPVGQASSISRTRSPSVDSFSLANRLGHDIAVRSSVSTNLVAPVHQRHDHAYRRSRSAEPSYRNHNLRRLSPQIGTYPGGISPELSSDGSSNSSNSPIPIAVQANEPHWDPDAYCEARRFWNGAAGGAHSGWYRNIKNEYAMIGREVQKQKSANTGVPAKKDDAQLRLEEEMKLLERLQQLQRKRLRVTRESAAVPEVLPTGGQTLVENSEVLWG